MAKQKKQKKFKLKMANTADRHALYQEAVQDVVSEIDFVDETFTELRGRQAKRLREDFCGTANTACEWVRRREDNVAIGIDIDGEVLNWGRENNVEQLKNTQRLRVELIQGDVFKVETDPVEIILAMNFSYWLFKDRDSLRSYFERARSALVDDGIMFLDAYGGYEAHQTIVEPRECDDFDYVWEQKYFNPINNDMRCSISFEFEDGSELKDAFVYDWRFWSLPEIQELLKEAGFSKVTVYWQGWDEEEEDGDGNFQPATEAESDPGWISYIVAEK